MARRKGVGMLTNSSQLRRRPWAVHHVLENPRQHTGEKKRHRSKQCASRIDTSQQQGAGTERSQCGKGKHFPQWNNETSEVNDELSAIVDDEIEQISV